jgi:hypothetical protein
VVISTLPAFIDDPSICLFHFPKNGLEIKLSAPSRKFLSDATRGYSFKIISQGTDLSLGVNCYEQVAVIILAVKFFQFAVPLLADIGKYFL